MITRLQEANDEQITYEMAAPLALFAFMLLAFPFARRRVVEPLESFGRQLINSDTIRYAIAGTTLVFWLLYFYLPRQRPGT